MTVGEKIQKHRKKLGMSQNELGQKLLVSRQTISLWEKDQTVPTIDNLKRLSDIFDISVDEILDTETAESVPEAKPKEVYQFEFTQAELNEIGRLQRKGVCTNAIIFTLISIGWTLLFVVASVSDLMIGFALGMLFIGTISHIKGIRAYKKAWKSSAEQIGRSTYEYKVFDSCVEVSVYREGERLRELKCYFADVEKMQQIGKWLFLQFAGQVFIVRKGDLAENSALYSCMHKDSAGSVAKTTPMKWRSLSIILFVASIASIFGAIGLVEFASGIERAVPEKMWMFFLLTPIPIASVIFGFILKTKGYKYLKNVIAGIIMTALLCIYGSFSFIFAGMYDHSDAPIVRVEGITGIDIPEHRKIDTRDWTKGTQSNVRGYVYTLSEVYFDNAAVEVFEKQIATDEKWLPSMPNNLVGITSNVAQLSEYDYVLIYNVDTSKYNVLPEDSGTFRFINILYRLEDDQMMIVEYDIDYVK